MSPSVSNGSTARPTGPPPRQSAPRSLWRRQAKSTPDAHEKAEPEQSGATRFRRSATRRAKRAGTVLSALRSAGLQRPGELDRRSEPVGGDGRQRLPHRRVDGLGYRSARERRTDGAWPLIILATTACAVGPVNGGSPASIS